VRMRRSPDCVYRSRSQAFGLTMCVVVYDVLMGTGIATGSGSPGLLAYEVVSMVAITLIGLRAALCSIVLSQAGIRVVNVFKTSRFSWSEIGRFDLGRSGLFPQVCRVHTKDGRVLRAFGIQEANISRLQPVAKRPAAMIVTQLNEEMAKHTPQGSSVQTDRSG
jgi:hypothetical protein